MQARGDRGGTRHTSLAVVIHDQAPARPDHVPPHRVLGFGVSMETETQLSRVHLDAPSPFKADFFLKPSYPLPPSLRYKREIMQLVLSSSYILR